MLLYGNMAKAVKDKRPYNATLRQEQAQLTRGRILDAARRLLLGGHYSGVTMDDIAKEAGVAYQTVYSVFGNKLRLAQAIIEAGWPHVDEALKLIPQARESADPEVWLRTAAQVSRRINEPCADLVRFMRESGDPDLLARYRWNEEQRFEQLGEVADRLELSGRLQPDTSRSEALAVLWAMTGTDWYGQLVFQRSWTPARYEEWLGRALTRVLLNQPTAITPAAAEQHHR
jgi:AcrR family transcriptional regulator